MIFIVSGEWQVMEHSSRCTNWTCTTKYIMFLTSRVFLCSTTSTPYNCYCKSPKTVEGLKLLYLCAAVTCYQKRSNTNIGEINNLLCQLLYDNDKSDVLMYGAAPVLCGQSWLLFLSSTHSEDMENPTSEWVLREKDENNGFKRWEDREYVTDCNIEHLHLSRPPESMSGILIVSRITERWFLMIKNSQRNWGVNQ